MLHLQEISIIFFITKSQNSIFQNEKRTIYKNKTERKCYISIRKGRKYKYSNIS